MPDLTPTELWRRYDDDEQRLSAHVSERMLDLAGVRPGLRVLDIASGRGEPALRAAARVAPQGHVLGTDRSDDMLAFARERARQANIANLSLQVADAQTLDGVPEQAFDVALCRWGLMYLPQPRQALAAIAGRLVADGCFVAASWAEPARVSYWTMPRDVLARQVALPAIDEAQPGPFQHARPERLRADLEAAGFAVEHEEELFTAVMESATPAGLVAWCEAFGLGRLLDAHPAAVREAWERDMTQAAAGWRDADGLYRLGGVTRLTLARLRAPRRA